MTLVVMKYSIVIGMLLLVSCEQDTPACFSPPEPFRGVLLDRDGNNLLSTQRPASLALYYFRDGQKRNVPFEIAPVRSDGDSGIYSTELFWEARADTLTPFYLETDARTDTLTLRTTEVSDGNCTYFTTEGFFNGQVLTLDSATATYLLPR